MTVQWLAALIPYSWSGSTPVLQRTVVMSNDVDDADRQHFYEALVGIPWLEPEIRRAVMKSLGRSPQDEHAAEAAGWKRTMEHLIGKIKTLQHKKTGKRPTRDAVLQAIAYIKGVNSETLRKRLQRLNK